MYKVTWIDVNRYGEYYNAVEYCQTYKQAVEFSKTLTANQQLSVDISKM